MGQRAEHDPAGFTFRVVLIQDFSGLGIVDQFFRAGPAGNEAAGKQIEKDRKRRQQDRQQHGEQSGWIGPGEHRRYAKQEIADDASGSRWKRPVLRLSGKSDERGRTGDCRRPDDNAGAQPGDGSAAQFEPTPARRGNQYDDAGEPGKLHEQVSDGASREATEVPGNIAIGVGKAGVVHRPGSEGDKGESDACEQGKADKHTQLRLQPTACRARRFLIVFVPDIGQLHARLPNVSAPSPRPEQTWLEDSVWWEPSRGRLSGC